MVLLVRFRMKINRKSRPIGGTYKKGLCVYDHTNIIVPVRQHIHYLGMRCCDCGSCYVTTKGQDGSRRKRDSIERYRERRDLAALLRAEEDRQQKGAVT